jgi:hypothetical protein
MLLSSIDVKQRMNDVLILPSRTKSVYLEAVNRID